MDAVLNVMLSPADGASVPLSPKRTDTLRSVIESAQISSPPNTQIICMSKGTQLKLDLSLGVQGVQTNDTIFVIYKKIRRYRRRRRNGQLPEIEVVEPLDPEAQQFVRRQNSIFEEALKVSDLSFLLFDYYRRTPNGYDLILHQQEEKLTLAANQQQELLKGQGNYLDDQRTVFPEKKSAEVSCEPLPLCFKAEKTIENDDEEDNDDDGENVISSIHNKLGACHDVMKPHDESNLHS